MNKLKVFLVLLLFLVQNSFGGLSISIFSSKGQNTDIKFNYNSAIIKQESYPFIDESGKDMKKNEWRDINFIIEGHTDSQGSSEYNLKLSYKRAKAIKDYLVQVHGIMENRLVIKYFGESRLIEKANTEEAHAINRRVIIRANKKQDKKSFKSEGTSLFMFGNIKNKTETEEIYKVVALFNGLINNSIIKEEIKIFNEDCTEKRVYQELSKSLKKPKIVIFIGDITRINGNLFFKTIDTDTSILKRTSVLIDEITKMNSLIILIVNKMNYKDIKDSVNLNNIIILTTDNTSDRVDLLKKIFIVLEGSSPSNNSFKEFRKNIRNNL